MRNADRVFPLWKSAAFCLLLAAVASPVLARHGEPPYSLAYRAKVVRVVPTVDVGTIDAARRRDQADAAARASAVPTKRLAVADGIDVSLGSERGGVWEFLPDGSRLWRLRVRVAGATDLRFRFARLALPAGATLYLIGARDYYQGPYTAADARAGRFESSVVPGDAATIEMRCPRAPTHRAK